MTSLNLDVSKMFNQFAGKEVPMVEEDIEMDFKHLGKITFTEVRLADQNDATVKAMADHAKANNLNLRLWWPGTVGTMDFRMNRVNANIEKGDDGKWRVSKDFRLG